MQPEQFAASSARLLDLSGLSLKLARAERLLFGLAVLCAAACMWLAPRLPMADLPQHAAQVALWRDLLLGQSPWAEMVRINLLTPYLIGYGLMLPLSFVFSTAVTTQIVLTLAFLAFVATCMALRRELGGDRRLDWLFLLSFLGYCWKWGFLTFLVASPVALLFLLYAIRHAHAPSSGRALAMILLGTILLFSHGLLFLASLFLGGLQVLDKLWENRGRQLIARGLPYVVVCAIAVGFRLATRNMEGAMQNEGFAYGTPIWDRPLTWLVNITDADNHGIMALQALTLVLLSAPLLLGLRLNRRAALVPLAGLLMLLSFAPADAFQAGGLYYRFALFIPAFVALAFRAPAPDSAASARGLIAMAVVVGCCLAVLAIQGSRIADFARESAPFETILAKAAPNQRAFALVLDANSKAAFHENVYWHYPHWYQADKHGFVDFNFAFFPPQVIRFRSGHNPVKDEEAVLQAGEYVWPDAFIDQYRYVFVRSTAEKADLVRKMSRCPLTIAASDGPWFLLEHAPCPMPPPA